MICNLFKNVFESTKRQIKFITKSKKSPLVFNDNFFIYDLLPSTSEKYLAASANIDDVPMVGLVIQGQIIKENDFTLETVKIYKKIFNNNRVKIIIATWNDEDTIYLSRFKDIGVQILLLNKPDRNGFSNINYQIKSSRKGLEYSKMLGCEYAFKTRTDQRIYATNTLEFMFNLLKMYPLNSDVKNQNQRIVVLSQDTFKYRFYGISDMFQFGHIDDLLKYWATPYKDAENQAKGDLVRSHLYLSPETYVASEYLKLIGHEPLFTLDDSLKAYYDHFCVINKEDVAIYWPKYTNCINKFAYMEYPLIEEFSYKDWLNLYMNRGIGDFSMPDFVNPVEPKLNFDYLLRYPSRAIKRIQEKEQFSIF